MSMTIEAPLKTAIPTNQELIDFRRRFVWTLPLTLIVTFLAMAGHRLQWFDHRTESSLRGWSSIHVTDGDHPYMGKWWVPGLAIGYEHSFVHQVADFLEGLSTGKPAGPTFRDALETQQVCDAVLASAKSGAWTGVK